MRTAFTPGIFSAVLVSMPATFACACGQRTILAYSIPSRLMSYEYLARPETLCGPSIREIRLPIKLRLSASGHLESAIGMASFLILVVQTESLRYTAALRPLHYCRAPAHIDSATTQIPA